MSKPEPAWHITPGFGRGIVANGDIIGIFERGGVGERSGDDWAALAVAAVNACIAINPENPMAVAENIGRLLRAFYEFDAGVCGRDCPGENQHLAACRSRTAFLNEIEVAS